MKKKWRWPNRIIPYKIEPGYSKKEQGVIHAAMRMWMNKTCIRFVEAGSPEAKSTGHNHTIWFGDGDGCETYLGYIHGQFKNLDHKVTLSRNENCVRVKTVAHELGHVIGLHHEQTRKDRDRYVRVIYENIPPDHHKEFDSRKAKDYSSFGTPYDYCSIMHYRAKQFGGGSFSIVPLDLGYISVIGQGKDISYNDATIVNKMYKCGNTVAKTPCLRKPCNDLYSEQDCKVLELENRFANLTASLVTSKGERCMQDHPCAKHGQTYYWCKTGPRLLEWDYCCAPGMSCGKHGENYDWCWANYSKNTYNVCKNSISES